MGALRWSGVFAVAQVGQSGSLSKWRRVDTVRAMRNLLLALGAAVLLVSCDDDPAPAQPPFVCDVVAPTVCPDPPPGYAQVEPIFAQRCVSCHYGMPMGPWPLYEYQHIADWTDVVRADVLDCSMPPRDAGVAMSNEERMAILTWILCGIPK